MGPEKCNHGMLATARLNLQIEMVNLGTWPYKEKGI